MDINQAHQTSASGVVTMPERSLFWRLTKVFSAPSEAFRGLTRKWDWLVVALVIATAATSIFFAQKKYLMPDLQVSVARSLESYKDKMPAEDYEKMVSQAEEGFREGAEFSIKGVATSYLAFFFFLAVTALALFLSGGFGFGGKAPFWQCLTVVAFTSAISTVGDLARLGLMTLKGSSYVFIGLGLLKPTDDGSFLFYLLRQVEFTTLWKLAVLCLGAAVIFNMRPTRFAFVIGPLWLLLILAIAGANMFIGGTLVY